MLYDKQTRSLWLHLTGECIDGPLAGAKLTPITGRHVLWREWKRDHPETQVMNEDASMLARYFPKSSSKRGLDFFPRGFRKTIETVDDRFSLNEMCYGISVGDVSRAYPFSVLKRVQNGVVNDRVSDVPVVVLFDRDTQSAAAHGRRLGGSVLVFKRAEDGLLVDVQTGSRFDRDGRCVAGALKGQQLPSVVGVQAEWYGWYATYPETTVFEIP